MLVALFPSEIYPVFSSTIVGDGQHVVTGNVRVGRCTGESVIHTRATAEKNVEDIFDLPLVVCAEREPVLPD